MANESLLKSSILFADTNKYASCSKNHVHPILRTSVNIDEFDSIIWPVQILGSDIVAKDDIKASQLLQLHFDGCPHDRLLKTTESKPETTQSSRKHNCTTSSDNILIIKEEIRIIKQEISELKTCFESLRMEINVGAIPSETVQPLKPALKRVTFLENAFTLDELIKFKVECKNRVYEAIYNARCSKSVVSPAYVEEKMIEKLSIRDRVRIYIPGKPQPLLVISEVATVVFKIASSTYTMEAVLHRDRSIPVVLGRDFGQRFIVGISIENKILTLKDDYGSPIAISFEFYHEP